MADEKILSRIQKLLSLATSDNENEAALAAAKAQTMLLEYNISEEELNSLNNKENERVIEVRTRIDNPSNRTVWKDILANTVGLANLCKVLITHGGLIWIGKPTNIEVAQYIYENLARDLSRICDFTWNEVKQEQEGVPKYFKVHGKTWKNNFYHGANQSISERLTANLIQLKQNQSSINALVVHNDVELKEYMGIHYPRLATSKHTYRRENSGFEAGKAAGKMVSFKSGIGAGGNNGPRLLNKG